MTLRSECWTPSETTAVPVVAIRYPGGAFATGAGTSLKVQSGPLTAEEVVVVGQHETRLRVCTVKIAGTLPKTTEGVEKLEMSTTVRPRTNAPSPSSELAATLPAPSPFVVYCPMVLVVPLT